MECNKDEAIRAKEIAEKKMSANDFEGARNIALRAQNLYPELDNISQMLSICDVHCSAQTSIVGSEKDWYRILQVQRLADEIAIKKQYRRLALILHPDKNRFPGAESAFKLICEANAVLSDNIKKSIYDSKVQSSIRSVPVSKPAHNASKHAQVNKQSGVRNNVANGFSSHNQQATGSKPSTKEDVFWTCCPYCSIRYQYHSQFVNRSLRCPTCLKPFMAFEIKPQANPLAPKKSQPGANFKPGPSQTAPSQEKGVPNLGNFKMGAQTDKGPPPAHAGPQGLSQSEPGIQTGSKSTVRSEPVIQTGSKSTVQSEPAIQTGSKSTARSEPGIQTGSVSEGINVASTLKEQGDLKANETHKANNMHGGKEGGKPNGVASNGETGNPKKKSRKRGRKQVVESSDSFVCSSDLDLEDVSTKDTFAEPESDLKSEPSRFSRRSLRRKHNVTYNESDNDDLANSFKSSKASNYSKDGEADQNNAFDGKDSKNSNKKSFPADADMCQPESRTNTVLPEEKLQNKDIGFDNVGKGRGVTGFMSGKDDETVEIKGGSDTDSYSTNDPDKDKSDCPDPEFNDFDKERDASRFKVDQYWACYDPTDGMPRFYAKVTKACASPFNVSIKWLEAVPINKTAENWVAEELPVGCGTFKFGDVDKIDSVDTFSHEVQEVKEVIKGRKRISFTLYPRKGDVWALFKDWDMNWSLDPSNHKEFKYEVVEVLSDFVEGIGIQVGFLDKVAGFVSLFQRTGESEADSYLIRPDEVYKFSHRISSFKMTGAERVGVPVGSFELDPASLPLNPNGLHFPRKAKVESGKTNAGDYCSPTKSTKKKNKSVISGSTYSPNDFVDLTDERSKIRKSPRGVNASRNKSQVT